MQNELDIVIDPRCIIKATKKKRDSENPLNFYIKVVLGDKCKNLQFFYTKWTKKMNVNKTFVHKTLPS